MIIVPVARPRSIKSHVQFGSADMASPPPAWPPHSPLRKGQGSPVTGGVRISFSVMEGSNNSSRDEVSIDGLPGEEGIPLLKKKVTQKYEGLTSTRPFYYFS